MLQSPIHDLQDRADSGDPFAQVVLGFLLENGLKGEPDKKAAEELYRLAVAQGFAPGKYALAFLLSDGNFTESMSCFQEVAEAGYAPAQFLLGCIYQEGALIDRDDKLAFNWIKVAVEQNYLPAIAHFANMFHLGLSVTPDDGKAMEYWRMAAERGDVSSALALGQSLVETGEEARIEEGLKWIWRAAQQYDPFACMFLADMYREGLYGVQKDLNLCDFFLSIGTIPKTA